MTGDNKTGAREFWIRHESILPGYGCKEKHAYESEQSNSCHVIEYSAFEQRGQELLKANLANQKLQERVSELEIESDSLRSRVLIQRDQLQTAQKKIAEIEKYKDKIYDYVQCTGNTSAEFFGYHLADALVNDHKKLKQRIAELEKGILVFNAAAAQDEVEIDSLHLRWTDLKSNYTELLEQANKLEEALNIVSVRTEVDHNLLSEFAKDNAIKRCKEVCNKALTQFKEYKNAKKSHI